MAQLPKNSELSAIFYQIPPSQIVLIKSLLESYEFLGELRTLDSAAGIVVVLALEDTQALVRQIVSSEASLATAREIDPPADTSSDWLLAEIYPSEH